MTLPELERRLVAASGPDRAIDSAIGNATVDQKCWRVVDDKGNAEAWGSFGEEEGWYPAGECPPYTSSIDAALTLVPEKCGWAIDGAAGSFAEAAVSGIESGRMATPAIALCLAAIRARIATLGEG